MDRHRAIEQLLLEDERRPDDQQRGEGATRFDDLAERGLSGVEQCILVKEIFVRISREAKLGEHDDRCKCRISPRWTPENRPSIDSSKPATTGVATETRQLLIDRSSDLRFFSPSPRRVLAVRMWESRVLCEISKALWRPFSGVHGAVIGVAIVGIVVLLRGLVGAQVGLDLGAPAPGSAFEHVRVMEQPIEERGDGGGVAEQLPPVVHRSI